MLAFLARLIAAVLLLAAPAAAQPRGPLVLAAASLQESMTAAADAWARAGHPRPVVSFAASSALARQVEAGGRADLFVSADQEWMDYLAQRRLLAPGTRANLLTNSLVLVAPRRDRRRVTIRRGFPLARYLGRGRLAMADPDSVPAGRYGKAALQHLGVWQGVQGRIVRGESVRAALAFVERGAAPYGIVYATDARASRAVAVAGTFPARSHPPIVYPVARLAASRDPRAESFRRFLLSPAGRAIFARYGFGTR